jgi:IS5 family transposase
MVTPLLVTPLPPTLPPDTYSASWWCAGWHRAWMRPGPGGPHTHPRSWRLSWNGLFLVIKNVFGYWKVRFKGLAKNTVQLLTLFALTNLCTARRQLMPSAGKLRPQFG